MKLPFVVDKSKDKHDVTILIQWPVIPCQRYVGGPQREITYSLARFCSGPPTPVTCSGVSLSRFSYTEDHDYPVSHKKIGASLGRDELGYDPPPLQ